MSHPLSKIAGEPDDPVVRVRAIEPDFTTPDTRSTTAKPGREAVLARLGEPNREIPEREYGEILDAFRHDREVHHALIGRDSLPVAIVERLIRLVESNDDLEALVRRHAVAGTPSDGWRSVRTRPDWWRAAVFGGWRAP